MLLMNVVQDDTMAVPGFEHHTFMCSDCHDVERRLVFTKPTEQIDADAVPVHAAPPIAPASAPLIAPASAVEHEHIARDHIAREPTAPKRTAAVEHERKTSPGILMRVLAKLRGGEARRS